MKQFVKYFVMAAVAVATLAVTSCSKDDDDPAQPEAVAASVVGHTFRGTNNDAGTYPYNGVDLPVSMTVTAQFTSSTDCVFTFDLNIGGSPQNPAQLACTYTLNGSNGNFSIRGTDVPFIWDASSKTVTVENLMVGATDGSGNSVPIGGRFVLEQMS